MAYIQRLIFGIAVLLACNLVYADYRLGNIYGQTGSWSAECSQVIDAQAAAMVGKQAPTPLQLQSLLQTLLPANINCNTGAFLQWVSVTETQASVQYKDARAGSNFTRLVRWSVTGVPSCPDAEPWNPQTGLCEVPPPPECEAPKFVNWLGVCVDPCPAAGTDPVRLNVNGGNPVCSGGCEKRATKCSLRIQVGGIQAGSLKVCDYVSSGNECDWSGERAGENDGSEPPDPEPDPQPDPCPAGQQRGQYNGQDICVKTGDTTDVKKEETDTQETTNPDGSKTTTETRTETRIEYNSTTNTTTTTTTTTTTNTIRDSSGNVTDTNTTITVGQKQTNGNNVDAEDSGGGGGGGGGEDGGGVFAGTCGVEPYCEGDAIQCAIAAATFKSQCALVVAPDVMSEWQQIVEFDGTQEGAGLDRKTIDVPQTLNVTMTGGGVGLVDQSFVVLGKTIVLPFSWINPYLDMFGAAMLAIAWIMAFGIIRSAI